MQGNRFLGVAVAGVLALGACTNPEGVGGSRTQDGVAIGAFLGGLFGATAGKGNTVAQTAAGAVVGGAIGGLIGAELDKQAAELDRDMGAGVGVVRTAEGLVVTMPQDLLFATDSAALRADLRADLNTLAASLMRYPDTRVDVVGHTDSDGEASYNLNLSQARANTVAGALMGAGVPAARIIAYGRGEDQPVASNLNAEGKRLNRRVEIIIRPIS